jgi:hypothetical protein
MPSTALLVPGFFSLLFNTLIKYGGRTTISSTEFAVALIFVIASAVNSGVMPYPLHKKN